MLEEIAQTAGLRTEELEELIEDEEYNPDRFDILPVKGGVYLISYRGIAVSYIKRTDEILGYSNPFQDLDTLLQFYQEQKEGGVYDPDTEFSIRTNKSGAQYLQMKSPPLVTEHMDETGYGFFVRAKRLFRDLSESVFREQMRNIKDTAKTILHKYDQHTKINPRTNEPYGLWFDTDIDAACNFGVKQSANLNQGDIYYHDFEIAKLKGIITL